jgi:hypothetical protein
MNVRSEGELMARYVTRSLVMVALVMVAMVGTSAMSPASAGPEQDWRATIVTANRQFDLRSCNRLDCARFDRINSGNAVIDMCRDFSADGGTVDAVFRRVPSGGPLDQRVGYAPTHFLNSGRTGNQCFLGVPGSRSVTPRIELRLRSCPSLSGCPQGASVFPDASLLTDICFITIAGNNWHIVTDTVLTDIGFVADENLVRLGSGLTPNRCG